jgi:hypothetical protein
MARKKMNRDEFERRHAELRESLRKFEEYLARRIPELEEQARAREEAERRRIERRRFIPFLR